MKRRRRDERGFVMLLVFLMAAIIAISLYMEVPRVSFESQRAKEGLLIERGEQYKRAIQVFVKANKKYPTSIKELESFNNHRYLRKQYLDPMTGKKEWRLVHLGPNGVFTDSLIHKPPKDDKDKDKDKKDSTTTTTTQNFIDPNNPSGQPQGPSAVPPRRQSEMAGLMQGGVPGQPGYTGPPQIDPATGQPITQPTVPGQPGMPPGSAYPTGVPGYPGQPGQTGQPYPGQPGMPPGSVYPTGVPGYPGQPGQQGQPYPGQPAQPYPGQPYPGQSAQPYPNQPYPGQPGQAIPGQPYMGQPGQIPGQPGVPAYPYSTQPGAQGTGTMPFQQPGYTPATAGGPAAPNDAQRMIQDLLTRPRQGGAPGQPTQPQAGQMTIGGGIAGVASTADAEGIKLYNDHSNYKEWEFLYDFGKDRGPSSAPSGVPGTPAGDLGTAPGAQPSQTSPAMPGQQNSPFGAQPGAFPPPGMGTPMQPPRQ